jgi:Terminase RNaseH-like domain
MGTRLGRQELEGEMLGDFEGALISRDGIDRHRIPRESIPLLSRVVVGVDPAMKAGEDHDESGIVVAGEGPGPDGELHAYIIDDRSLRGTPNRVMHQVAAAFRKWEADCVVLEVNQGGDFVRDTLRTVDSSIPVREVHAMKSKVLRAEQVSALMPGEVPVRSPDRADAAVYAIFELRHLGQGGSWLSAYNMASCPNCKATLGVKRLKCPECGHERQPEPEPEEKPDGELKGWAAVYAPRKLANSPERVAATLRQWSQGNFTGASPVNTRVGPNWCARPQRRTQLRA